MRIVRNELYAYAVWSGPSLFFVILQCLVVLQAEDAQADFGSGTYSSTYTIKPLFPWYAPYL